MGREGEEWR